jgi:hypothetical protein
MNEFAIELQTETLVPIKFVVSLKSVPKGQDQFQIQQLYPAVGVNSDTPVPPS